MCRIEEGFKLCTCGTEKELEQAEVTWELKRKNHSLNKKAKRGKCAVHRFDNDQEKEKQFILTELNERNCFDIEITFEEDDSLKILIKGERFVYYTYRYVKGEWKEDKTASLAVWKTQLEKYKKGCVS